MNNSFSDFQKIHIQQTTSTNCHLLELSIKERLPEGSVVVTDNQTHGRGHSGNAWESESGSNLTFSIILYPLSIKASGQFILSKAISLAVYDFISEIISNVVTVKWPNDVYVNDKKISGILIENFLEGEYLTKSIVGIGVNINQKKFVSNAPNPVSLRQLTEKTYALDDCLKTLHTFIMDRYRMMQEEVNKLNLDYLQNLYRFGRLSRYNAGRISFDAVISGIDHYGLLELTTATGERKTFGFKEIDFAI